MSKANGIGGWLLWVAALTFSGAGLLCIVAPVTVGQLLEFQLSTATAEIDFIATYGGFELGWGIFLGLCARQGEIRLGLLSTGCCLLGFGLSRVYGLLTVPGSPSALIYAFLVLELIGGALSIWISNRAAV